MDYVNQDHVNKSLPVYATLGQSAKQVLKRMNIKKGCNKALATSAISKTLYRGLFLSDIGMAVTGDALLASIIIDLEYAEQIDGPQRRKAIRDKVTEIKDWCLNTGTFAPHKFE